MPSRDEEIFWCLKQLFTSQFWPKTATFNLGETESLVFAIKRVFFFFSYEYILGQPKEAYWQELSDGYVEKYVWHWFVFPIKHVKNFQNEVMIFPIKKYLWTLSVLSMKQKA